MSDPTERPLPRVEIHPATPIRRAEMRLAHARDHTGVSSFDPRRRVVHCDVCDLLAEVTRLESELAAERAKVERLQRELAVEREG